MNSEFSLPPDAKARQQMLDQEKGTEALAGEPERKSTQARKKVSVPPAAVAQRGEAESTR
jgi:hypothetical protein